MCDTITVGESVIITIRALAEVVGYNKLAFVPYYAPMTDLECCLCALDLPATAQRAGITLISENGTDWTLLQNPDAKKGPEVSPRAS